MLVDGRDTRPGFELRADVCVVGAGAAGITLARGLGARGLSVLLLESGGFEDDAATTALGGGRVAGNVPRLGPSYLTQGRLRYFGGSTGHWAGQCRPLDALDFQRRPGLDGSGWPFARTVLAPYYDEARHLLGMEPFDDGPLAPDGQDGRGAGGDGPVFHQGHPSFVARAFRYAPVRFGQVFRAELAASAAVRLCLHANVVGFDAAADGGRVRSARVVSPTGVRWKAHARTFVLATGALENARLLLHSTGPGAPAAGLGNAHDVVGRYFMEHPHIYEGLGLACLWKPRLPRIYLPDGATMLFLSPSRQLGEGLGAVAINLVERAVRLTEGERHLGAAAAAFDGAADADVVTKIVNVQAEQQAQRDSRVTLSDERDALGTPTIALDWRLGERDLASIRRAVELLASEVAGAGLGRVRIDVDWARLPELIGWGYHPMGTTRMHDDPRLGVCDGDGRVHGLGNLFVAGSSLFPTSGAANPTLTLLALALRQVGAVARTVGGPEVTDRTAPSQPEARP